MAQALCVVIGLGAWYIYFGAECVINGAPGSWDSPFVYWWIDFQNNLPATGALHRLQLSGGDVATALKFPGPIHFALTNVLLPASGWLVYQTFFA